MYSFLIVVLIRPDPDPNSGSRHHILWCLDPEFGSGRIQSCWIRSGSGRNQNV